MKIITLLLAACALGSIAHAQESARVQGFSVVLLLGEQAGSIPTQGLSASAQRAIADIKEFLPYKGYRVLDTQWVAGSEFGQSKGRIRGIDKQDFEFQLDTEPTDAWKTLIPVMPPASDRGTPAPRNSPSTRARFQLVIPGPAEAVTATGKRLGDTTMLDNSFAIKPGETVVVGTSRVQGDNALIVLLTAVPAGK